VEIVLLYAVKLLRTLWKWCDLPRPRRRSTLTLW